MKKLLLLALSVSTALSLAACGGDTTYSVEFDSVGGSAVTTQTVISGEKAVKPINPTKDGYNFTGWTLDGKDYSFDTEVTSDLTLKAGWESSVNKFTVTFSTGGGTVIAPSQVEEGSLVTKPTDPTKFLNSFVEWQLNGVAYDFSTPLTSAIELVAVWSASLPEPSEFTKGSFIEEDSTSLWDGVSGDNFIDITSVDGLGGNAGDTVYKFSGQESSGSNKIKVGTLSGAIALEFDVFVEDIVNSGVGIKIYTNGSMSSSTEVVRLKIEDGNVKLSNKLSSSGSTSYTTFGDTLADRTWNNIKLVFSTQGSTEEMLFDIYINNVKVTSTPQTTSMLQGQMITGVNFSTDSISSLATNPELGYNVYLNNLTVSTKTS